MISIENLTKSFGANAIFDEISFKINHRERIGLVGRNGHGKTTLLKIIIGEEPYDSGTLTFPKNYRIGYVRQHLDFTQDTVLKEGMKGLPEDEKDHYWKAEKILSGLGFSNNDMQRHPGEFSGGYQVRLNLAKMLVSDPDLLLLDEPTNYLDITSIRWVERFLLNWQHELILITHDRSFMDKVVTHTMCIHRKKIRKIPGDTEKLYTQIAQDEEVYEKTRLNDERKQKEVQLFISRFRAKARLANMVQSRIKTLAKMEKRDKLEEIKSLDFTFRSKPFAGKFLMNTQNITFSYDADTPLIKNFNIHINAGDRVCVIGKNGKGKTTLLKILAGVLTPHEGDVIYHPTVTKGFYEQTNIKTLVDNRTVEEEILYSSHDVDRQKARNICGAMMFEGESALKKIEVLSGGEKSRVMLGKMLVTPVNLLLLDEPTNHLDMDSCDALLAAIDNFNGTVIMVTHNEMFLHALAKRLIVFQNDRIDIFEGIYQEFLEKGGWQDESAKEKEVREHGAGSMGQDPEAGNDANYTESKMNKKEFRRRRSEIVAERAKVIKPLEQQIKRTENDIDSYEKELETLHNGMQEASQAQDGAKIAEISQSIHFCQKTIDRLFDELEQLTDKFEKENAIFEERLRQFENVSS